MPRSVSRSRSEQRRGSLVQRGHDRTGSSTRSPPLRRGGGSQSPQRAASPPGSRSPHRTAAESRSPARASLEPASRLPQDAGESAWILLTNLPNRASWNKVRGIFSEIGCSVLCGKVKRDKGYSIVKLASAEQAIKAQAEIDGHTFRDIPGVPIQAKRIPESERSIYDC
mmetsp:Transcript_83570/g.231752  ORF Transcript_83570/g.231752 Transcript_83570/m.231752 type:complete len:169 (+) Transcript_83570:122-628(+)